MDCSTKERQFCRETLQLVLAIYGNSSSEQAIRLLKFP